MGRGARKPAAKRREGDSLLCGAAVVRSAATVVALALVAAYLRSGGFQTPARASGPAEWQNLAPECSLGTDFHTIAELLERRTPCLVRGLESANIAEVTKSWSPSTILRLPHARGRVTLRATEEPNHTRVMRYSNRNLENSKTAFNSKLLGFEWPRGQYDQWEFAAHTMFDVLNPQAGFSASFSASSDTFRAPHPSGAAAIDAVASEFASPHGETQENLLWMASRGLGQQLHFDSSHNLFFQLHGVKHVVMCPPEQVMRRAHLYPGGHPAQRQSQILWSGEDSDRHVVGFGTDAHGDTERPPPTYNASLEQVAYLRSGDVLYMPALWGHQTFSELGEPTVSLALWYYPDSPDSPISAAIAEKDRAVDHAVRLSSKGTRDVAEQWAAVRELGLRVAAHLLARDGVPLGDEEVGNAIAEWQSQRWRPQFGALGIEVRSNAYKDAPPLPDLVCRPLRASSKQTVDASASTLASVIRLQVGHYFPEYQEAYLHFHLGNILDQLVIKMRPAAGLAEGLNAAGVTEPTAQIGVLLHSFMECGEKVAPGSSFPVSPRTPPPAPPDPLPPPPPPPQPPPSPSATSQLHGSTRTGKPARSMASPTGKSLGGGANPLLARRSMTTKGSPKVTKGNSKLQHGGK
jgi:hypothetical protein